jgi:hypothetical protein
MDENGLCMGGTVRALILMAMLATLLTAAACDGSDDDKEQDGIRTQQGLSVAAASYARERADDLARGDSGAQAPSGGGGQGDARQPVASSMTQSLDGLTVSGYGVATADPDSAIVELYFASSSSTKPGGGGSPSTPIEPDAPASNSAPVSGGISEADLQSVIDAILAAGVAREDIELVGGSYYDPTFSSVTLRVAVRDIGRLGAVMQAATDAAASLSAISLQGSYVNYTVSDCAALERAALRAAKDDADARAAVLAEALGVSRGAVVGAADYAYDPYGGNACGDSFAVPFPVGGIPYAEAQTREVQLFATITVTYGMQ